MLYSHDTMGLGHTRRNLLIAQTLARSPLRPMILMVAGMREIGYYPLPSGVDCLSLPALRKRPDGEYEARSLDLPLQALIRLRSESILTAVQVFQPDVFVVDNVPRGAVRELDPTLEYLRSQGRTRCVLGLRDVLDDPSLVRREWCRAENEDAIRRNYSRVWIYGDPTIYDLVRECSFGADLAVKVRYTGYLDQCERLSASAAASGALETLGLPPGRLALCLVGGGQDGAELAEAFAQAELPPDTCGLILTGPFMSMEVQQRLRQHALGRPELRVVEFCSEPTQLLQHADCVVTMGGYNSVCEVLSFGKRALVVPRIAPRREQWVRAERLHQLGLLDVLHPDRLTPRALSTWLARDAAAPSWIRSRVDLQGLSRLPTLLEEVVLAVPSARPQPVQEEAIEYVQ